jgi:hypothetical protein
MQSTGIRTVTVLVTDVDETLRTHLHVTTIQTIIGYIAMAEAYIKTTGY